MVMPGASFACFTPHARERSTCWRVAQVKSGIGAHLDLQRVRVCIQLGVAQEFTSPQAPVLVFCFHASHTLDGRGGFSGE
eukprot:12221920-Alexandrium_andersonii.AAC.1